MSKTINPKSSQHSIHLSQNIPNQYTITINHQSQYPQPPIKLIRSEIIQAQQRLKKLSIKKSKQLHLQKTATNQLNHILNNSLTALIISQQTKKNKQKQKLELMQLQKKTFQVRQERKMQIDQIKRAVYLTKLNQGRHLKNLKEQYKNRVQQLKLQSLQNNKQRFDSIRQISGDRLQKHLLIKRLEQKQQDEMRKMKQRMQQLKQVQKDKQYLRRLKNEEVKLEQIVKQQRKKAEKFKNLLYRIHEIPKQKLIFKEKEERLTRSVILNDKMRIQKLKNSEEFKKREQNNMRWSGNNKSNNQKFRYILEKIKEEKKKKYSNTCQYQ